ncbi:MAG: right-handed parallel beta-helix repeat-containing protein [Planctomycetes bacterium]|nr:right-handed parallel beta-helix repeat-containing protein [Planctomycetota bacterium]
MRLSLSVTLLALSAPIAVAQTIIPVTTLANSGAGSLRTAIITANTATSPIIDVRVAGTIVLQTVLPLLTASRPITIRRTGVTGRLILDGRIPTATTTGTVLFLQGSGSQILAPLSILVDRGVGLRITAGDVRVDDVEITGGTQYAFWGYQAPRLLVARLRTSLAGIGVRLEDCDGSRLGVGGVVEALDNTGDGIVVTSSNSDVAIESFVAERNNIGVMVLPATRIALGRNGRPRSRAAGNRSHGVLFYTVANTGVIGLQNADVVGNGAIGVHVDNGSDIVVEDTRIAESIGAGIDVGTGTLRPTLRRCTIERNFGNGVEVWSTPSTRIEQCTLRDNLGNGVLLYNAPGMTCGPGNRIDDNRSVGVMVLYCADLQFVGNESVARNRGVGMDLRQSPRSRIAGGTFAENDGISLWIRDGSQDVVVGPDLTVRDARGTGITIENVGNTLIHACTVLRPTVYGIHCITDGRMLSGNRIVNCLIAGSGGLGVMLRAGPPLRCELSTIVGNQRGIYATNTWNGQPSRVDVDSCILWNNAVEDLSTTTSDGLVVAANSVFRIPAPNGNGNRTTDPRFLDPAAGDWRLQRTSPLIDSGNAAIVQPAGTTDAWGQPRLVGARVDCGGYEVPGNQPRLGFFPDFMPAGGGNVGFTARYPAADHGALAALLLEIDGPSGTTQVLGTTIPLANTPFLTLLAGDSASVGTLTTVPAGGLVQGQLAWHGRVPSALRDVTFHIVGITIDTTAIRTVTEIGRIRLR